MYIHLLVYHQHCCVRWSRGKKLRTSRAQSTSARILQARMLQAPAWHARLSSAHSQPSRLPLRAQGLCLSLLSTLLALPSLGATTGRAAAPFVTSSSSPLPATETTILQVCPPPSLSFCCARRSTANPNKTICIRI